MQAPGIATPAKLVTVVPIAVDASEAVTREHASTEAICWALVGDGDGEAFGEAVAVEDEPPQATASKVTLTSARVRANIVSGP